MQPTTKKAIVLFDGVCNLCNVSVQFTLKHDKKHHFIFAALQSDVARDILLHYPEEFTKKDSILLMEQSQNLWTLIKKQVFLSPKYNTCLL